MSILHQGQPDEGGRSEKSPVDKGEPVTSDIITVHQNDWYAQGREVVWREPDGDHRYRGIGNSPAGTTGVTWGPCLVCEGDHDDPIHGDPHRWCSWCGSIHPRDLFAATIDRVSWADWKYGYPHKLYVDMPKMGHAKFYTRHLIDFPDLIEQFNERFGGPVRFVLDEGGLRWARVQ